MRALYDFLLANSSDFVEIPAELRGTKRDISQRIQMIRIFYGEVLVKRRRYRPALYKMVAYE